MLSHRWERRSCLGLRFLLCPYRASVLIGVGSQGGPWAASLRPFRPRRVARRCHLRCQLARKRDRVDYFWIDTDWDAKLNSPWDALWYDDDDEALDCLSGSLPLAAIWK